MLHPHESGQLSTIMPHNHGITITYISCEISIEHPSVGLASLAPTITQTNKDLGLFKKVRKQERSGSGIILGKLGAIQCKA